MRTRTIAIGLALAALAAPGRAEGLGAEVNGARAGGHWGGEFGVDYRFGLAGFDLTPGGGAFVSGGSGRTVRGYARLEAGYTIPIFARLGAGVRYMSGHARPYGTVSVPLLPLLRLKANGGPHYAAVGLTLGH
jgi:hypothetical protein